MGEVSLTIGDRRHLVACRDGEEDRLHTLAAMLNQRWPDAVRAAGGVGKPRAMLFVALLLADALDEALSAPTAAMSAGDDAQAALADRLEALADALEQSPANA